MGIRKAECGNEKKRWVHWPKFFKSELPMGFSLKLFVIQV
jgi:hypothetical protein